MRQPLKPLPLQDFDGLFDEIILDAWHLCEAKSKDYDNEHDVLANFRAAEDETREAGEEGDYAEEYLLARVSEKVRRVKRLLNQPNEVAGEGVEDSLLDILNYTIFTLAAYRVRGK